jgi:uncharacterized alpha-E superfamily protein
MLSRTADNLYWIGRYTERAGNVARGLSATWRMAMLAAPRGRAEEEWRALLVATGSAPGFLEKHGTVTQARAIHWLTLDADNPSGIAACVEAARRNARAVRTALTVDMWSAINDTWSEMRRIGPDAVSGDRLAGFLDWVQARTLLFNGSASDTMLRSEAWHFVRLGTLLERGDNTARLLDARHADFDPRADAPDPASWQAALRAVSALRAYQHVFRARLSADRVADLLLLRPELPRSVRACQQRVQGLLETIAGLTGRRGACQEIALALRGELAGTRIDEVLETGLHATLTRIIDTNVRLGAEVTGLYLSGR